jgi:hypothetical protein
MFDRKLQLEKVEDMRRTYLIQRLKKPTKKINVFSFGGGLKNGGLSDNAMELLSGILSFDYMGASEFEWGAVPNALHFLGEQAIKENLINGELSGVFYLCPSQYEDKVKETILALLEDEYKLRLKEGCYLKKSIEDPNGRAACKGWIELDNGFMFFVDKEMFESVAKLFGLERKTK